VPGGNLPDGAAPRRSQKAARQGEGRIRWRRTVAARSLRCKTFNSSRGSTPQSGTCWKI